MLHHRGRLVVVASAATVVATFVAIGCGVDVDTGGPFVNDSEAGAAGDAARVDGASDPNVLVTDGGVIGTTDGGDGGAASDSGALADGEVIDGGAAANSPPGGNTQNIPCGNVTACPISSATCCAYPSQSSTSYLCVGGTACPAGSNNEPASELRCTATANCGGGNVCCAFEFKDAQDRKFVRSQCQASCNGGVQLCDRNGASGCRPDFYCSGEGISELNLPASWGRCKD